MKFANANTGFIAHSSSKLLRTTNAGYNWDVSVYYRITSVCTIDSEKVYAVGNDASSSYLYKSSNRGIIWDSISSPVDSYTALHFFNKDTGVISGGNTFDNFIWRTTDGGLTKQLISTYSGAATGKFFFLKEKINGEYYGWMYYPGSSPLRRTTNSGLTWSSLSSFSEYINSVYFVNRDTGWATPYYARDYLYYTTNGGVNWTTRILPYSQKHDIYFVNSNIGWVSCDLSNKIFVTTNGGFIWGTQTLYGGASFDLYFLDSLNGWAQTSYNSIAHTTNGGGLITSTINNYTELIPEYKLYQNYPNPFNPTTSIKYYLKKRSYVEIKIYDISGRELIVLLNKEQNEGNHELTIDFTKQSSGIYFYRLNVKDASINRIFSETKRMILLK
jgi:photosystem II stability/assembly factor-like uncharacterized protein